MKTLLLVRHAKASRDVMWPTDKVRPLEERGKRDAPKMGERLAKRGLKPDLMLSSPAVRAVSTAELMADALGYSRARIVVDERIYASAPSTLLAVIHGIDDAHGTVVLFGHNPEFSELATQLAHGVDGVDGVGKFDKLDDMPTCAVATFTFDLGRWVKVGGKTKPVSVTLDTPKDGL